MALSSVFPASLGVFPYSIRTAEVASSSGARWAQDEGGQQPAVICGSAFPPCLPPRRKIHAARACGRLAKAMPAFTTRLACPLSMYRRPILLVFASALPLVIFG